MSLLCQAIIFDLDGVLVDSNAICERHMRGWAERRGVPWERLVDIHHGRTTMETFRLVAPELDAAAEALVVETAEADDTDGLVVFAGAARLLSELPADRWAVATSGTRRTATIRLRHAGLPLPRVLITADDVTR